MNASRRAQCGQSLTEFAAVLPVLILLFAGLVDLGRAFYFEVTSIDAARDGARLLSGNTQGQGPGLAAVCKLVQADLASVAGSPGCGAVSHPPPYAPPGDYTTPGPNNVVVIVYCGQYSGDCVGADRSGCSSQSACPNQAAVYVYYGFTVLLGPTNQLAGPLIMMQNGARMVTAW